MTVSLGAAFGKSLIKVLAPALVIFVVIAGAFYAGMRVGKAEQEVLAAESNADANSALLRQYQVWIAENVQFAKRMEEINRRREELNSKTTQELSDALAATAHDRDRCRFPDGSMFILKSARERAASAAAGGLKAVVPGAAVSDKQPP